MRVRSSAPGSTARSRSSIRRGRTHSAGGSPAGEEAAVAEGQRRIQAVRSRSARGDRRRHLARNVRWRRLVSRRRVLRDPCKRHAVPESRRFESAGLRGGGHGGVQPLPGRFPSPSSEAAPASPLGSGPSTSLGTRRNYAGTTPFRSTSSRVRRSLRCGRGKRLRSPRRHDVASQQKSPATLGSGGRLRGPWATSRCCRGPSRRISRCNSTAWSSHRSRRAILHRSRGLSAVAAARR